MHYQSFSSAVHAQFITLHQSSEECDHLFIFL